MTITLAPPLISDLPRAGYLRIAPSLALVASTGCVWRRGIARAGSLRLLRGPRLRTQLSVLASATCDGWPIPGHGASTNTSRVSVSARTVLVSLGAKCARKRSRR